MVLPHDNMILYLAVTMWALEESAFSEAGHIRLFVRSDVNSVIDTRLLKGVPLTGLISDCIVRFVQLAIRGGPVPSPNTPTLPLPVTGSVTIIDTGMGTEI